MDVTTLGPGQRALKALPSPGSNCSWDVLLLQKHTHGSCLVQVPHQQCVAGWHLGNQWQFWVFLESSFLMSPVLSFVSLASQLWYMSL